MMIETESGVSFHVVSKRPDELVRYSFQFNFTAVLFSFAYLKSKSIPSFKSGILYYFSLNLIQVNIVR